MALISLSNWSEARPQVGGYANPISWAIAHIKAGGDVALGLYSVQESDGTAIVGAVFDSEDPIIPDAPRVRVALNLSDLLRPVLSGAEALQSRVVN